MGPTFGFSNNKGQSGFSRHQQYKSHKSSKRPALQQSQTSCSEEKKASSLEESVSCNTCLAKIHMMKKLDGKGICDKITAYVPSDSISTKATKEEPGQVASINLMPLNGFQESWDSLELRRQQSLSSQSC
nr:hypothetical protein Iba_chr12aCG13390 [Ipomoea batatas]